MHNAGLQTLHHPTQPLHDIQTQPLHHSNRPLHYTPQTQPTLASKLAMSAVCTHACKALARHPQRRLASELAMSAGCMHDACMHGPCLRLPPLPPPDSTKKLVPRGGCDAPVSRDTHGRSRVSPDPRCHTLYVETLSPHQRILDVGMTRLGWGQSRTCQSALGSG